MIKNDIKKPLDSVSDDDSPLYSIPEDDLYDDGGDDDSCAGMTEMDDLSDGEDSAVPDCSRPAKTPAPFGVLIRSMLTPVEGFKALKRARFKTEEFAGRCFYPLIALAAVSDIAGLFYKAGFSIADWMVSGFSTFMTFFFGYFTILLAGPLLLPAKSRPLLKKDIGRQFVMLALSTLAIFWTVIQVAHMLEPVLVFLPLWTIYLVYKGVRVIRVPSEVENSTTGILCMLVIGVPILWSWLISELLIPATGASL